MPDSPSFVEPPRRSRPANFVLITLVVVIVILVAWQLVGPGFGGAYNRIRAERDQSRATLGATRQLTAEKDSLTTELLETTSLITDVSQAITAVQSGGAAPILQESGAPKRPMTAAEARAFLMPKIDSLRRRLRSAETRLAASVARVKQIPATAELQAQIVRYQQTVTEMRRLVTSQEEQVATLTTEVAGLRSENAKLLQRQGELVATQQALQDTMVGLKEDENTVYWIAGSKQHLLELGVVTEEGSGKVLVFGKGKLLMPARALSASDFMPVNKRQTNTIALPKPAVRYRILTRQDLTALDHVLDRDGHVRGSLSIRDPAAFWAPSSYLILVEDN